MDQKGERHMSSSQPYSTAVLEGAIWNILNQAIKEGVFPGAQFELRLPRRKGSTSGISICMGGHTYEKCRNPISWDTKFDVASITKTATTLIVHHLDYWGKLSLKSPLGDFFRSGECSEELRERTVLQGLSHQMVFHLPDGFPETKGIDTVNAVLHAPFDEGYRYGNYCMVPIGELVKRASEMDLPLMFRKLTKFRPKGAEAFWFNEATPEDQVNIAPTRVGSELILPHDPLACQIADSDPIVSCGVAGLFADAKFLSWLLDIILYGGEDRETGERLFKSNIGYTLCSNVVADVPRILARGDVQSEQSKAKPRFSAGMDLLDPDNFDPMHKSGIMGTFGCGGFTGCGYFAAPSLMTSMVLLTNAILGKEKERRIQRVRKSIWEHVLLWHHSNQ